MKYLVAVLLLGLGAYMARGHADWNILTSNEVLAPGTFDRRGEVLWKDNFENDLGAWNANVSGAGGAIRTVTTNTDLGGIAAELTSGSDVSRSAEIHKNFVVKASERIGFEVSFWETLTLFETYQFQLERFDGVTRHQSIIRLTNVGLVLAYLNSGGTYTDFGTAVLGGGSEPVYNRAKLVVDFETDQYVRFLLNEQEFDLSGIAIRTSALAVGQYYTGLFRLVSPAGQNDVVQVGRAVITENEP